MAPSAHNMSVAISSAASILNGPAKVGKKKSKETDIDDTEEGPTCGFKKSTVPARCITNLMLLGAPGEKCSTDKRTFSGDRGCKSSQI